MIKKRKGREILVKEETIQKEKYIVCSHKVLVEGKKRFRENWVNIKVCRERSQGISRLPEMEEYIEENCLGCIKWLDQLRSKKKKIRKRKSKKEGV